MKSIRLKIFGAIALTLPGIFIGVLMMLQSTQEIGRQQESILASYRVITKANEFMSSMQDAETGQRGYIITGDPDYLEPYTAAKTNASRLIDELYVLDKSKSQRKRIAEMEANMQSKFSELGETIRLRRDEGFESALKVVKSNQGKRIMDALRRIMADFQEEEIDLLNKRQESYQQDRAHVEKIMIAGFAGLLLLTLVVAGWVTRSLVRPLRRLSDYTEKFAAGDFSERVEIISNDEVGSLSRAFNHMIDAIEIRSDYDQSYAHALALFSTTNDRKKMLTGMLSMLAEYHTFPVSAVYLLDEWSADLQLAASHGASSLLAQSFERGEGLVGLAALENKTIMLDGLEDAPILSLETGVLSFIPAAMAISPICYQDKVVGVLVLASDKSLSDMDQPFIERLCLQTGVALNNVNQHENMVELSGQLRQRSEEIGRQNKQLEQANRMKSEFLATMSHELRTPLNAIIGFSEVLKDGVMGDLTDDQQEYIGDIFNSGQHLLTLINDILDLSKIEAGKMELNLEAVDVPQLLGNSLTIVKEKAMAHSIKLSLQVDEAVGVCNLDARKGKQILFNLLSNAVKFTPDGGQISLAARIVPAENIHSHMSPQLVGSKGEFLELQVTDSGIGISKQDQQKLFQAFVQADSKLSRQYEGTGLGLVMVKRLAELHGGGVDMTSEHGKGSTFTVWLPYRATGDEARDSSRAVRRSTTSMPASGNPLVMIVEDEDAAANLMRIQLEDDGYRTCRAASAEEAMEMLERIHPDLITLDIMLPGMDGWDFLAKLKASEAYSSIPVVIISIVANEQKGFSLGASQVLQKPVRKNELFTALAELRMDVSDGKHIQILVVDDDPKAVEFVSRHLQSNPHCSVLKAYGGAEAIETACSAKPDLILLDLMMPEVTGFDVVEALKSNSETADIPIIILTAKVITAADRRALNGNIVRIMEKSRFDHASFLNEVKRAIGKSFVQPGQVDLAESVIQQSEKASRLVLVVEDNASESELLKRYLEDAGCRVSQAANGIEALIRMNEARPDLITLDLSMPEMDGFTFLNEKAQIAAFSDIPVVIVSGLDETGKGLSLGASAVLRKPIAKQEMLGVVASLGILPKSENKPGILLVDDDPNALKIIGSYFDPTQYRVGKAMNGKEGLDAALTSPPDLIVLDLMMPEMNGFEVIDHLKRHDSTKDIPIIIVTAKFLSDSERRELAENVQSIKEKSQFDKEQFLTEVRSLLRKGVV